MSGRARRTRPPRHVRLRSSLRRHGLIPRPEPVRELLRTLAVRFTEGNRVELFASGRSGLEAMLDAIRGAIRFVHLETYILRDDATGRRFRDALVERARAGVAIRLLYDAVGSIALGDSFLAPLREVGGDVVAFNPLRRFYPRWAPRRRDHRKILVVDNRLAFTGGLNIGDEYDAPRLAAQSGEAGWRDTHARIEGPAVRDLNAVFLESWFRADGPELPWSQMLEPAPPRAGDVRCAVVPDGPAYRRRTMRDLLIAQLEAAHSRARLTTPYFAPGRKVLDALEAAAKRGVSVELILAGRSDHPVLRRAAHALLPKLLEAGVQIHEYEAAIMHAKSAVFDGRIALLGTSNLDRQSFEHSYEVNLVIDHPGIASRLDALFEEDGKHARRIDAAHLARRSLTDRLLDRLASLLLFFL